MATTAAETRKAQDDLVKSSYESLASTQATAEHRITDPRNIKADLLETADIAR
jgi:hypothetical protein